ncbi:MAG TPA: flagellar export chaperone FliS [Alphaproteobacteria bacterium]|nr:flagellar export chaperone FliS [Alphaproteobacteria bacterium]
MAHNPYHKASQAYQKSSDDNLTPLQIIVELYKGMIKNTKLAKQAYQEGRLDVMSNHLIKTFDIIEALHSNLDLDNGGEDAAFLDHFYSTIFSALSQASTKPDPLAYFDEIVAYIQQVHDRWYSMAYGHIPQSDDAEKSQASQAQ